MWISLLLSSALAYETDQLTDRQMPLADITGEANAEMDRLLAQAAADANRRSRCSGTDAEMAAVLAASVADVVGGIAKVPPRGDLPTMTFGAYAAWLETAPLARRTFTDRRDIYGELKVWENPIIALFGLSSTVKLNDTLLGTDKIDHFLVQGYLYYRRSQSGLDPFRAMTWGTHTERGHWGQATTGVFSYADLSANYRGLRFYAGLMGEDGYFTRGADGCVVQDRPFDWAEWVDWTLDEVLNPPVYDAPLQVRVSEALTTRQDQVCEVWDAGAAPEPQAMAAVLTVPYPYALGRAPTRVDPFRLADHCDGTTDIAPAEVAPVERSRAARRARAR